MDNESSNNKLNILIFLVLILVIVQISTCIFSYKIKQNSYVTANASIGHVGGSVEVIK